MAVCPLPQRRNAPPAPATVTLVSPTDARERDAGCSASRLRHRDLAAPRSPRGPNSSRTKPWSCSAKGGAENPRFHVSSRCMSDRRFLQEIVAGAVNTRGLPISRHPWPGHRHAATSQGKGTGLFHPLGASCLTQNFDRPVADAHVPRECRTTQLREGLGPTALVFDHNHRHGCVN